MKAKKWIALALSAIMLLGLLTACGNDAEKTSQPSQSPSEAPSEPASEPPQEGGLSYTSPTEDMSKWQGYSMEQFVDESVEGKTIAYQLNGVLTDDQGNDVPIMSNLYADGFARIIQYRNGYAYYYYGYWVNMDGESITTMYPYYRIAGTGSPAEEAGDSYGLEIIDGEIYVAFSAYLAPNKYAPRSVELTGDGAVAYETDDAFLSYAQDFTKTELKPDVPDNEGGNGDNSGQTVLFSWTDNQGGCTMDFYSNCTYKFAFANMGIEEKGTWSMDNWTLKVVRADGTEIEAGRDEAENTTYVLPFVSQTSDKLSRNFTCTSDVWGPALGATGTYTPAE